MVVVIKVGQSIWIQQRAIALCQVVQISMTVAMSTFTIMTVTMRIAATMSMYIAENAQMFVIMSVMSFVVMVAAEMAFV